MKRINTIILLALLLAMGLGNAKAQVVDVCAGNDSVVLRLGNFQYGYVQWQVSDDNMEWQDIDGAIDTVYRFLPERPRYYRAEVRFPACTEYNYHSQVSYVQVSPKAFAGPDLTIPAGTVARMHATRIEGAEGEWSIISGVGGTLEDSTDNRTGFIGEEGEYKLTWTVTNSCGSNTDTVSIKCVRMEYQPDIVIVDETDAILSDSTQRVNGEYIISFNEPIPDIQEGSVLIGYMYPSFLRKVVSFEREGNLFVMQTEAGALSDVILTGVLNIDPVVDSTSGRKPNVKYLDRFPTRKEMQEDPFLLRDGSIYVIKDGNKGNESIDFDFDCGFTLDGYLSIKLYEFDFKKLSSKLDGLKYSTEVRIYPNFEADIEFDENGYVGSRIGFYEAEVEIIQHVGLSKPLTTTLVNKEGYFNKNQIFLGGFLIGVVPTFITLDLPYLFKVQASIEPPMSFTKTNGNTYTYEITQRGAGTPYVSRSEKGTPFNRVHYEMPVGSISAELNTGVRASVLVADVLGPYFEFRGNFDPYICASAQTGDIGGNINMGVDLRLGCRFQLFSPEFTLFDWNKNITLVDHNEPAPKKLIKYAGDNQIYNFGQYLETPITVNVTGWFNMPMPGAYVHFIPEHNGIVSDMVVATDIHGMASTRWKPGVHYGSDRLKVEVYNCQGEHAAETPQFFYAYTSATDPCINNNLTVEAYKVNENTIIPLVNGGKRPYLYSIDGENYSSTAPEIHLQMGHTYCFYVIDNNGCEAMAYYNGPSFDCENTTLRLTTNVNGNSVIASAMFGMEPYQFFIDGRDYHDSSSPLSPLTMHAFGDLFDGEYMVRVRDNLGCEQSQQIVISRQGNLAISLSEIVNNSGTACVLGQTNTLIDRGICWSTHHEPTVQDFRVSYGTGLGDYTFIITALDPNLTYYVRAYALDGSGTSYSREVCINPNQGSTLPLVASTGVTNVTATSAYGSGNVTYDGGSPVVERGICWGTNHNPTVAGYHLPCSSGTGAFTGEITGLTPNMTYYVRAYATNSVGTAYSETEVEFYTGDGGGGGVGEALEGAIKGLFSVGEGRQVCFSQGNLQYNAQLGTHATINGGTAQGVWRFAENQYNDVTSDNSNISPTYDGWIDLFGWGTSGWNSGNEYYQPWDSELGDFGEFKYGPPGEYDLVGAYANSDWGVYNAISNGGDSPNLWRTPTIEELDYIVNTRSTNSGIRFAKVTLNGFPDLNYQVPGLLLLPDDWSSSFYPLNNANQSGAAYSSNVIDYPIWIEVFEANGAVFLPGSGSRAGTGVHFVGGGYYWSVSNAGSSSAQDMYFDNDEIGVGDSYRYYGESVRLVHDVDGSTYFGQLPQVTTSEVSVITSTTALCGGEVVSDGGITIKKRGVCWSTSHNPTISCNQASAVSGTGSFAVNVLGLTQGTTYYVRAFAINNSGIAYGNEVEFTTNNSGAHEYVDLGLPSGTLWATCNIGANTPDQSGYFYAWGETERKSVYDWSTYQFCYGTGTSLTKYCNDSNYGYHGFTDDLTVLLPEDDVATVEWGSDWRMPTMEEIQELYENTTNSWTTINGHAGRLFTSANGSSLFLPVHGYMYGNEIINENSGHYWSSSLNTNPPSSAWEFYYGTGGYQVSSSGRFYGNSVRPVRSNSGPTSEVPEGAVNGLFSVGEDTGPNGYSIRKVYFSKGNLQYQASTNTWRFAENQWDYAYFDNLNISPTYDGWIDLFGWGTSGYDHGSSNYQPWSLGGDCYAYGDPSLNLNDQTGQADWGYNPIINGGNQEAQWRTLTQQEWEYVINDRNTASGMRYALAEVAGISGLILLPDDWDASFFELSNVNMGGDFSNNVISEQQWQSLEQHGAVFFPTAGVRINDPPEVGYFGLCGYYWSATAASAYTAFRMSFSNNVSVDSYVRILGHSVRLVQDAPNGSGSGNGGGGGHK